VCERRVAGPPARRDLPYATSGARLGDDVLEIGPGPGVTTDLLRHWADKVTAVELDAELHRGARGAAGRHERHGRPWRRHRPAVRRRPLHRRDRHDDAPPRADRRAARPPNRRGSHASSKPAGSPSPQTACTRPSSRRSTQATRTTPSIPPPSRTGSNAQASSTSPYGSTPSPGRRKRDALEGQRRETRAVMAALPWTNVLRPIPTRRPIR
jgi:hypothetical protein